MTFLHVSGAWGRDQWEQLALQGSPFPCEQQMFADFNGKPESGCCRLSGFVMMALLVQENPLAIACSPFSDEFSSARPFWSAVAQEFLKQICLLHCLPGPWNKLGGTQKGRSGLGGLRWPGDMCKGPVASLGSRHAACCEQQGSDHG